ncbi:uncharacterized protein LOC134656055 [Cydia amplana]|uniref:uncharacterized protein LOC134656055 n=1 Tax=Cydia amplana TaxID=1869771 RepID=UPI002FE56E89
MAKPSFDVKTAIALLPVMTGQEDTTKQLIDGIIMYSSIINSETQQVLIEFVLKTRLSSSAKLRLKTSYTSVELLIADMRTFLLPKKSSESIQAQLYRARQGRRTIEAFGAEIEDLFVNLTISQADGNDSRYDILRPLNEKSAIKRFADGLADPKLSTIISSRQFTSLPEAIRTAIDEHSSSPQQEQVLHYGRNHYRNNYGNRNAHSARYNRGQPFNMQRNTFGTRYYSSNNRSVGISQHVPTNRVKRPDNFADSAATVRRPARAPARPNTRAQHIQPSHDDEKPNRQFFRD